MQRQHACLIPLAANGLVLLCSYHHAHQSSVLVIWLWYLIGITGSNGTSSAEDAGGDTMSPGLLLVGGPSGRFGVAEYPHVSVSHVSQAEFADGRRRTSLASLLRKSHHQRRETLKTGETRQSGYEDAEAGAAPCLLALQK